MAMKPTDKLIAPSRGDIASVRLWCEAHGRQVDDFLSDYLREVLRLAPLVGLDFSIVVSQSAHECFNPVTGKPWDSFWFKTRGNPAGLGITGDEQQNAASGTWQTGTDAARAQIVHLAAYTYGDWEDVVLLSFPGRSPGEPWGMLYDTLSPYKHLDPRFDALYGPPNLYRSVKTISDLAGKWATDLNYATKIAERGNAIWLNLPNQTTNPPPSPGETPVPDDEMIFGRVPHPGYLDRLITNKPAGVGWDNLGKRSVKGVVYHRMIGTLWGTDGFFRDPSVGALTDYGVGNAATDGAANDGLIIRWNDPLGTRSGWASGKVSEPYGDGKAFLDKYAGPSGIGVNVVNRDQASIEISGIAYTTPISEKVKDTVAAISAYWADQYRIPWDVYPIAPQDGFSFVRYHQEFTIGTGKVCPGKVVMDATNDIIERTRTILKKYQTTVVTEPTPTPEPEPTPVPSPAPTPPSGPKYAEKHPLDSPPRVRKVNEILFYPFKSGASVRLKTIRDVTPQEWASPTASATGPIVKKGSTKVISYVTVGSDDTLWMVGADGSRYPADAFEPAA